MPITGCSWRGSLVQCQADMRACLGVGCPGSVMAVFGTVLASVDSSPEETSWSSARKDASPCRRLTLLSSVVTSDASGGCKGVAG